MHPATTIPDPTTHLPDPTTPVPTTPPTSVVILSPHTEKLPALYTSTPLNTSSPHTHKHHQIPPNHTNCPTHHRVSPHGPVATPSLPLPIAGITVSGKKIAWYVTGGRTETRSETTPVNSRTHPHLQHTHHTHTHHPTNVTPTPLPPSPTPSLPPSHHPTYHQAAIYAPLTSAPGSCARALASFFLSCH